MSGASASKTRVWPPSGAVLHFEQCEYEARLTATRRAMAARGIEVLIVSDPSNMAWLTGYDGWSFYTHQCVMVTGEGDPVWWGRGIDRTGALRTVYMGEEDIVGYADDYVQSTICHPMEDLAELVLRRAAPTARVGVEMDNYYFSAAAYGALRAGLPDAAFVDATGLVNWQRAVKSERELAFMQRAAAITDAMHAAIVERAEPGMAKNKLVAEIYHTAISGADGHWGDYPAIVPMLPSGLDATAPHLTWDDRPFQRGEGTFFEISGCYRRYHAPLSRTLFFGKVPQKFLDAEQAVLEGMEAGLAQAKPGNRCADIANAFFATLRRHGFEKNNRTGYSIGLSYPPDWGERTMSLRSSDDTELRPDMCFHFMPGLWLDDGGIEITEAIRITASGFETLCATPRRLFVKD